MFDEQFLSQLSWEPDDAVAVENPISQHWIRLVTTLMPHLLKNISENAATHHRLRFFEWNRVWHKEGDHVVERKSLAGIWYDKKASVDFYQEKDNIRILFNALGISVTWTKAQLDLPWWSAYQTALLTIDDQSIGYAGKIDPAFLATVAEGEAFIFELNGTQLLELPSTQKRFAALAKYPATSLDVSMLVPVDVTVDQIAQHIKRSDGRIFHVELVDFYEKKEWVNERSITMRFYARDPEKTLTKEDIDHVHNHVLISLKELDATIR